MKPGRRELVKLRLFNRRGVLGFFAATGAAAALDARIGVARSEAIITRPIPSTGEKLAVVGLGTWITFNVGYDEAARAYPATWCHWTKLSSWRAPMRWPTSYATV
jgi:hypothetical protein